MTIDDVYTTPIRKLVKYSTGVLGVDLLLSGGWTQGKIVEISGGERSGKSTLAYTTVAAAQIEKTPAFWVTAREHSFVPHYAKACGISLRSLGIITLQTADRALDVVNNICETMENGVIVLDDLSRSAYNTSDLDSKVPRLSRKDGNVLAANAVRQKNTILLLTDESCTWVKTHPYWVEQKVLTSNTKANYMDVLIVRNPGGVVGKGLQIPLIPEQGVNNALHLLQMAVSAGVVKECSAYYTYEDRKLGHGKAEASTTIRDDELLAGTIRDRIAASAWAE